VPLPLLRRIHRLKELPVREVLQVLAPLRSIRRRQALPLLEQMLVLLPSGAGPHDLTLQLLFLKLLRYEPQLS
jgi:hypothetical protein